MKIYLKISTDDNIELYKEGILIPDTEINLDRIERALEVLKFKGWERVKLTYKDLKPEPVGFVTTNARKVSIP